MDFGLGLHWGNWRHMVSSSELVEAAEMASEMGFASLWATDRWTPRSGPKESSEPLVTLASLIHVVPSMQLGVAVMVLPQRNPVVVAKQAATLSVLSGGRLLLGVGVGWNEVEFKLLGAEYSTRGKRMDESIEAMRQLWREDNVTFHGRFYGFQDATMSPKPPAGRVPLWIGGNSPAAMRRAARLGDGWVPSGLDPARLGDGVERMRQLSEGRPMPTVAITLFVDAQQSGEHGGTEKPDVAGTVEEMVSTLRAYERAGLEHAICRFNADNIEELSAQMGIFSEGVMSHFSK